MRVSQALLEKAAKARVKTRVSNSRAVTIYRNNNIEAYLLTKCRRRAKLKGLEFTLKKKHIKVPTHCPVLGIPLFRGGRTNPNSPTVDRIHNNRGYTPDNIVVISFRANMLKRDATLEELVRIGKFYGEYL